MSYIIKSYIAYRVVSTNPSGGGIQSVQAGTNITIDNTDPLNPIINATGGGTITSGNATTANGTAVDLGGTQTDDVTIEPNSAGTRSWLVGFANSLLQIYWKASFAIQMVVTDSVKTVTFGSFGSLFQASSTDSGTSKSASFTVDSASNGSVKATINSVDQLTVTDNGTVLAGIASPAYASGKLVFNSTNDILEFMNSNNMIRLQIGHELWTRVYNNSGSTIANGKAVYVSGTDAVTGLETIALARADAESTMRAIGLTTQSISNNTVGVVTSFGRVNDLDTTAYSANTILYLSTSSSGDFTTTQPSFPNYTVRLGRVVVVNATTGAIQVTPPTYTQASRFAYVTGTQATVNNNAVANTLQDATTYVVSLKGNRTYKFVVQIPFTSAATTTGSRAVLTPSVAATLYQLYSLLPLTATSQTIGFFNSTANPSAANGTAPTAGGHWLLMGSILLPSDGTVQLQFASEVAGSAVTALAGGYMHFEDVT